MYVNRQQFIEESLINIYNSVFKQNCVLCQNKTIFETNIKYYFAERIFSLRIKLRKANVTF